MRKKWTDEEISYLKKLYMDDGLVITELYSNFKKKFNRSETSVKIKIKKLKLKHTSEQKHDAKSRINFGENNGMYGKIGPNRGKTKENCERIRIAGEKISKDRIEKYKTGELSVNGNKNGMYGKIPWNKNKTKYNDDRLLEYGKKLSIIFKNRWLNLTEEEKIRRIGNLTKCATKMQKDTKIERIVDNCLNEIGFEYHRNFRSNKFVFDFFLPKLDIVIECQGDYWHANPIRFENKELSETQLYNIERDKRKINYLKSKNYKHIYLWEKFIYDNFKNLKEIIFLDILKNENSEHL